MKRHKTSEKCPFCRQRASLTTEWGWIDNDTCTATLCCPTCRTDTDHCEDAVQVTHIRRRDSERETESAAINAVLRLGLPAEV
jgi:hypothetical protein